MMFVPNELAYMLTCNMTRSFAMRLRQNPADQPYKPGLQRWKLIGYPVGREYQNRNATEIAERGAKTVLISLSDL